YVHVGRERLSNWFHLHSNRNLPRPLPRLADSSASDPVHSRGYDWVPDGFNVYPYDDLPRYWCLRRRLYRHRSALTSQFRTAAYSNLRGGG
ncbi:hypothetical protein LTR28_007340, partial [Elasticomyces elasticus]